MYFDAARFSASRNRRTKTYETAIVPGIYDAAIADSTLLISTEDSQAMTKRLWEEEGLSVGISSGANISAALKVAKKLSNGTIVTILCDDGNRYTTQHARGANA